MNRWIFSALLIPCFFAVFPATVSACLDNCYTPTTSSATCSAGTYSCACTSTTNTNVARSTAASSTADAAGCDAWCATMSTDAYSLTCTYTNGSVNQSVAQGNVGDTTPTAGLADAVQDAKASFIVPKLNIPIGEFTEFSTPTSSTSGGYVSVNFLAEYINAVYGWVLSAAALVAVVMMMLGGLQYVLSRGKPKYIEKAKTRITNAITGLVLLLAAYEIAYVMDPATTALKSLQVVNVEGIEADLAGQGGEQLSEDITPNDLPITGTPITGDHISYIGSASNKSADADVVTALQAAATAFYTATGKNITVTDATRSLTNQATLFYNNCLTTGTCSVPTCNPASTDVVKKSNKKYVLVGEYASLTSASAIISAMVTHAKLSNCPHTSAVALDAWAGPRAGDFKNDIALQQSLITAMINAGFCRLSLEAWHFELDAKKVSTSACSKSWNTTSYTRKDNGKIETPTADCKIWNFKKYYCAVKKG